MRLYLKELSYTHSDAIVMVSSRPARVTVRGVSTNIYTQGGAAYGRYLYQFCTYLTYIYVWDMETETLMQTINNTASLEPDNHAGNGGFGLEKYNANDSVPILYIGSMDEKKIYGYRLAGTVGSQTISKVIAITIDTDMYVTNIATDTENNRFVVFGYKINSWSERSGNESVIGVCDIPPVASGNCTVKLKNVFHIPYIYAQQGAFVCGGKLYLTWGNTADTNGGGLIAVDLARRDVVSSVGLGVIGNFEPEACVCYDGTVYITTQFTNGKVYVYKLTF